MLQFITNASSHDEIIAQVRKVIAGGCRWVQLRLKGQTMLRSIWSVKRYVPCATNTKPR